MHCIDSMKRGLDMLACTAGLALLSPLFAVIALCVKLSSPGPAFFLQTRVGRNKVLFKLFKFRTMIMDAEKLGSSVTTMRDSRVTKVGRFLRSSKLDELPQLLNVLIGDMSLVGPRPEVPEIVTTYTTEMMRIFCVRPGITSIVSLYFRDEEELLSFSNDPDRIYVDVIVPLKVALALEHLDRNSILFDLGVLFRTILVLLFGSRFRLKDDRRVKAVRDQIVGSEGCQFDRHARSLASIKDVRI